MANWHIWSFSGVFSMVLLSVTPLILLSLIFILFTESCVVFEWEVLSLEGVSLCFPIMVDKMSLVFSFVVFVISFSVFLFSISYMSGDPNLEYFTYMVFLFVVSMNFLIFIPHLLFILLGWDGLGITSYLLVIYYQNDKSLSAGMITVMMNRVGDSLFILAICIGFAMGFWSLGVMCVAMGTTLVITVLLGSMTKSAQVPFSAWLPAAMAAPTPVSSLVHSSTLVTAGVYVLIRFYPTLSGYSAFHCLAFYFGVTTCLMASLSAIYENDLKKVVAFSTLSQLGVMFMALGLGFPTLAFFHLITHALFKALLFICSGTVIHSMSNNQDMRLMGDVWYSMPMVSVAFNVANLALCGIPFMAGFYSKDLIVESVPYSFYPLSTSLLLLTSVVLTGSYSMRVSYFSLWSPYKGASLPITSDRSSVTAVSLTLLSTGAVVGGSSLMWVLFPFAGVMVMPTLMKLTVIFTLLSMVAMTYSLLSANYKWPGYHFMGSIWYLSFLSSSPFLSPLLSMSVLLYTQELTWVEVVSGGGVKNMVGFISSYMQESSNFSFSTLFSLFTLLFTLTVVLH